VWDDQPDPAVVTPTIGLLVAQLVDVLDRLGEVDPTTLDPGQALGEAEALLAAQRTLRVLQLARTEDVASRLLHEHRGFRSTAAWLGSVAPDAARGDRTLARRLTALPHLASALNVGRVSLAGATRTAVALGKVRPYLDRPDGLVDGVDGEELLVAVGDNVIDLLCRHHFGLDPDDPAQAARLAAWQAEIEAVQTGGGSQAARLEQLLVILTAHLPVGALKGALEDVVLQVLPNLLERREQNAQDKRAVSLSPNEDGTWDLSGTLTPECGELLFTALAAEARRDPANPVDTLIREQHRREQDQAAGRDPFLQDFASLPAWEQRALHALNLQPGARTADVTLQDLLASPSPCRADDQPLIPAEAVAAAADRGAAGAQADDVVGELLVPRSRSKRLHDAFQRLLERYLGSGLGGTHGKVPVQAVVTVSSRTLEDLPGAPPGRGGTGRPLARSLIRRWWCDAHVTTLLMSHGWTPLGVVHSARTLTGTEYKAATVQFDNRCAGDGCCPGTPDPLIPLVPHHVIGHAVAGKTSLGESLLACPTLHHDLHSGKKTVRLRDGRLLNEHGFVDDVELPLTEDR
jgi:hypothetical protein